MRTLAVFILIIAAGCATLGTARPLTPAHTEAVRMAEAFVLRHGFTREGHPEGLPVEHVELYDLITAPEEILPRRRGTMEPSAFGIARAPGGAHWVLFRRLDYTGEIGAVTVQNGVATRVVHSRLALEDLDWRRVPAR